MSLHDLYIPDPPIECPGCGASLTDWTGYDGPAPLSYVWRQGIAAPVDQLADPPFKQSPERRSLLRLPPLFKIYGVGTCTCGQKFPASLRGLAVDEVWFKTEIDPPPIPAKDGGDGWIQCADCSDVWPPIPGRQLYLCPACGKLTQLT